MRLLRGYKCCAFHQQMWKFHQQMWKAMAIACFIHIEVLLLEQHVPNWFTASMTEGPLDDTRWPSFFAPVLRLNYLAPILIFPQME